MNWSEQFQRFATSFAKLGGKRIFVLVFVGIGVFVLVVGSSIYLTRPHYETLYTGLDSDDIAAMG